MKSENPYEILGISKNASEEDIKKAYRDLAKKYHPDVNQDSNAEDIFKIINEAYATLNRTERFQSNDSKIDDFFNNFDLGKANRIYMNSLKNELKKNEWKRWTYILIYHLNEEKTNKDIWISMHSPFYVLANVVFNFTAGITIGALTTYYLIKNLF